MARNKTRKLTMSQALVANLSVQYIEHEDGTSDRLCGGVFAIFGHGNVTCLGEALYAARGKLPTYRGQNEQAMGLACAGYARSRRRRGFMAATSSIGPGATNMVTAAAVAHANRLPVLFMSGDIYVNRLPDPVLQQVENHGDPSTTVNDAFRPVVQYWDRVIHPAQLLQTLPQMYASMVNPATCGPAFLALPQDIQEVMYPYPEDFFAPVVHRVPRMRPDARQLAEAAQLLSKAAKPLIVAGGGVGYSFAETSLGKFAQKHRIPVVETIAGRATLLDDHPCNCGPLGVTGSTSANELAEQADTILAVGTRLGDFTTSSGVFFGQDHQQLISINASASDAVKRNGHAVVGDAKVTMQELSRALGAYRAPDKWLKQAQRLYLGWKKYLAQVTDAKARSDELPSYGQVMGAVNRLATKGDVTLSAAGGLPGEHFKIWSSRQSGDFDCEFGFSCMGYEIAGAYGFKIGRGADSGEVIALTGDGSYLMLNSDILSSVMTGHKLIIVLCDNGGYAVINRLQMGKGSAEFNNLFAHCKGKEIPVDFAAHAASMGARSEQVSSIAEFEAAFARAKRSTKTYLISIRTAKYTWTGGDAWWDTGVPEVSTRTAVRTAYQQQLKGRSRRKGGR